MRCFEAEAFSGSVVEVVHGDKDFFFCDEIEAHFLWEELADQAVHVLVGAPLPGGVRMGEEEVSTEFIGNSLVLGKFSAVVSRQRMHAGRKGRQQGNHGIRDSLCGLERDVGEQRIARHTLVHRDKGLLLSGTDDQVCLPVAKALAAIDDDWAFIDRDLVGYRATSVTTAITLLAELLATQGTIQNAAGTLVGVDPLVDGFMADGGLSVGLEVTRDLLRTPGLAKFDVDNRPCLGGNTGGIFTRQQSRLIERMCLLGPVSPLSTIT